MKSGLLSHRVQAVLPMLLVVLFSSCTQSPAVKSAAYIERGKGFLQKNDTSRAILEFRNAIRTTPKNAEAFYQLGVAYIASGDLRNGIPALRKALELNPKHAAAQLRLAGLMSSTDDPEIIRDAQRRLEEMVQDNPQDFDALHLLGLTEWKLGQRDTGMKDLERASTMAPHEVALAATLAEAKLEQKDLKGAEEVLKKACTDTKSAAAYVILGRLYVQETRNAEAEQQFQQALAITANYGPALFNLALLQNKTARKQEAEATFRKISSLPDETIDYMYAAYLFGEGRRDEATREFERIAKKHPASREARTRLISAYEATNRLADAQRVLNDALKKNPKDLEALLQRAELLLNSGKLNEAETDLNHIQPLQPDSARAHYSLSRIHEARGAGSLQRQELTEALKFDPTLLPARLALARALIRDNAAQNALTVLDDAPPAQKNQVSIQEARNWALIALNKYGETRQTLAQVLRTNRTPIFLLQDAMLKLSAKDYAAARSAADEAFRLNPRDVRALRVVAQTYIDQAQLPEAIRQVQGYAAGAPNSAQAQQYLGELLSVSGKLDEARKAFSAAKIADPNFIPADLALAQLDVKAGKPEEARKRAQATLAAHPNDFSTQLFLSQLDVQARNYSAAASQYLGMLRDDSKNILVLNNLAYSLAESGKYDEALKYGQQAKELAPERADVNDTIGWVMYRKGIYGSAIQYLKTAVVSQSTALNNYHLAMAYLKAGDQKLGQETLRIARSKDPNLPEAKAAEELLSEQVPVSK